MEGFKGKGILGHVRPVKVVPQVPGFCSSHIKIVPSHFDNTKILPTAVEYHSLPNAFQRLLTAADSFSERQLTVTKHFGTFVM